jgi:hypothetical protein
MNRDRWRLRLVLLAALWLAAHTHRPRSHRVRMTVAEAFDAAMERQIASGRSAYTYGVPSPRGTWR